LVFNYHRVGEHAAQPWDHTLWSASAAGFDAQLAALARNAEVIGPDDVATALRGDCRGRRVLLTFDDGYRDNFEIAYPLLRRHRLSATFFLVTGFLDRPHVPWWDELAWMVRRARTEVLPAGEWLANPLPLDTSTHDAAIAALVARYKTLPSERTGAFLDHVATATGSGRCDAGEADELWMTWEMAREMRAGGMAIGGHTATHPVLAQLAPERQAQEIATCASRLEQELGEKMSWFAYPVGSRDTFTDDTQRILRDHGVQLAFSFYGGLGRFSQWDPLDVPRVHVGRGHSPELVAAMVQLPRVFARW
jgi:peptidoglycan/xylan/chitin deacetylase (PgdA/CDA1 family)